MNRNANLGALEAIIGYTFANQQLGVESLCAAGAITSDGNRLLAMTGDVLLKLVLVDDMSQGGHTRGTSDIKAVLFTLTYLKAKSRL